MQNDGYENKQGFGTVRICNKSGVTLHGLAPNAELDIAVDYEGAPLDRNWRRRMADSAVDGCVEVVKPKTDAPVETRRTK